MARKEEMETLVSKKPPEGLKTAKGASAASKALITRNLRLAFGEVASEPMPDRFLDLLGKIDEAEKKQ
ncbi:MAG: hypothetical protein K2P70_13110 [Hyphomonadaceae bacterium]|jgi:hypothetical protein|nr:hypothetical protein [Hyphomonadaceae bacterium]